MNYVIHKSSRQPGRVSYSGPTWDVANMRDEYEETYKDRKKAETLACYLGRHNTVGFKVSKASQ